MHLLLIEDDRQFIELVERVAGSLDLEFIACTRARDGLERLSRGGIDLLVVDGLLPDKSGWQVLEELHTWPGDRPIIVFLSAFFRDLRSFRRLHGLGVARVLHKPISPHELRAELAALLHPDDSSAGDAGQDGGIGEFSAELARMRQGYAEKLATDSAVEFAGLLERAIAGDDNVAGPMEMFLHRLAGTASRYGHGEISEAAGRLEGRVRDQPPSELIDDLHEFLAVLRDGQRDGDTEIEDRLSVAGLGPALVVTGRGSFGDHIADQLAPLGIETSEIPILAQAIDGALRWWPGFVVVDGQAMTGEDAAIARALATLGDLADHLPVVVMGDAPGPLPDEVIHLGPDIAAGESPDGSPDTLPDGDLAQSLGRGEVQPFAGQSVLLCDGDELVADNVRELFAPLGILVHHAGDLASYKELLIAREPSVVLLDIALPMVSGFDLCRMTRADPALRDIAIFFVSARTRHGDRRTAYRAGGDGYLTKPIVRDELCGAVIGAMRKQRFTRLALWLAAGRA